MFQVCKPQQKLLISYCLFCDDLSTKHITNVFFFFCRGIKCCAHLFDGRHLDGLIVVQRRVGRVHVVAETSHRHLVTVMQCHRYSNCSQSWNVLDEKKNRCEQSKHHKHLYLLKIMLGLIWTKICSVWARQFWNGSWFLTLTQRQMSTPSHVSASFVPLSLFSSTAANWLWALGD